MYDPVSSFSFFSKKNNRGKGKFIIKKNKFMPCDLNKNFKYNKSFLFVIRQFIFWKESFLFIARLDND